MTIVYNVLTLTTFFKTNSNGAHRVIFGGGTKLKTGFLDLFKHTGTRKLGFLEIERGRQGACNYVNINFENTECNTLKCSMFKIAITNYLK